ncbi:MAG: L-threonine 3-dehydrogenase, partial [Candidatus Marinimicrobia bacterium]|nr:L-threonine 3-dehydrogenase [Candidatus Neomarinimicrobiota bacterium]
AEPGALKHRNAFNVSAMSFDPEIITASIRRHIPEFTIDYDVDPVKQGIADTWPNNMNDSTARAEWGWQPEYNLEAMTKDMLEVLSKKL